MTAENGNMDLPEGEPLAEHEADNLMRAQRTGLVVVGGWTGSGKTTLITSIYESFLDAPFAGQLFAGSLTLPGFERACHEARVESGRSVAATERTPPSLGIRCYHLDLVDQLEGESYRLLIADMSGELLREACNSADDAQKLHLIRRADHFVLLINGESLVEILDGQLTFNDARLILRALLEAELIGPSTCVDIVFAKWDVIQSSDGNVRDFIEMIQAEILSRFADRVGHLKFFSVAARPKTADSPFAFGVADLFRDWITRDPPATMPAKVPDIEIKCGREFAHFTKRLGINRE